MAYYQVLVAVEPHPEKMRQVFTDIGEKDLKQMLVAPYRRGTSLICGNEIIPVTQIRKLQIVQTARTDEIEREELHAQSIREIEKFNRESDSVVLISPGGGYDPEDILDAGEDVTAKFISGHPGSASGPSPIGQFLNNAWVVGLVVTLVSGLAVAYSVWKFGWNK